MVVLYDGRGTGLSGGVTDWSFDSQMLDLDAVANHLSLSSLHLVAPPFGGPTAIAYAASYPERISHLTLWNSWARTADAVGSPQAQALLALIDQDWEILTETLTHVIFGWSAGAEAHEMAVTFRENVSQELMRAYLEALLEFDSADLLESLRMPTLVVHCRQSVFPGVEVAQGLASRIPSARLVLLEGPSVPWVGDMEVKARVIEEFGGDTAAAHSLPTASSGAITSRSAPIAPSVTAVILFADIVDSTALTERFGDAAFRAKARDLDGALRGVIREHAGTAIEGKLLGDGVLAVFTSARQAIEAALACGQAGAEASLPLHLGLHAGDVLRESDPGGRANVYGGAVNIASRISGLSAPGEVLVSETVRSLARTSAGVRFEDRGEQALKGVGEPMRVWAIRGGE
jgi:class 3 adenylate cyclase